MANLTADGALVTANGTQVTVGGPEGDPTSSGTPTWAWAVTGEPERVLINGGATITAPIPAIPDVVAARPRYRVWFGPVGAQPTGVVRCNGTSFTEAHLGAGSATISFPIDQGADTPLVTRENFRPRRTAIWIVRNDVPVWVGQVWNRSKSIADGLIDATALGPLSYFRRRFVLADQTYTGLDQFEIVRRLIAYAQGVTGGDIGIVVDTGDSGVTRTRTYPGNELKEIGEALEQLAAVENGFDFWFEPDRDVTTGEFSIRLRLQYPATGRDTAIIFAHGENCTFESVDEDAEGAANETRATGAGQGDDLLIAAAADVNALNGEPLLQSVAAYTDVTTLGTLQDHADRDLTRALDDELFIPFTMLPGAEPRFGSYEVGDRVRAVQSDDYESIDRTMRVISRTVDFVNGNESVSGVLGPVDPVLAPEEAKRQREAGRRLAQLERARGATPV